MNSVAPGSPAIDLQQFELVFKEHYSSLFQYVKSIVKDADLAKDVLSDLFMNLWVNKDRLEIQNIRPYLFRSARNGALKAISAQSTESLDEIYLEITEETFNPFERIVAKESIRIVEQLMRKLPAMRKEIIQLRLHGFKNHEIARILDITEKKVEYHMREAIEQLTYFMNQSNFDRATIAGGLMMLNVILTIF
ncbi:sigma-70 family RNA polymerase sigma factor [Mucilaginibacter sp. Bleaf8]|uniref:sigma-70 family RNA polymerase sigma factor n=1 Tax=Mucilaginibacter sp. Bleaf8 TaxID=2834430 RepID=UPI001BCFB82A|nr:sigma-70 family RNA polymerase sigma factor [Mucilaginibacter sp. Bleaf8]MBS7564073.1 sigma-70 family RNA polymerase sigma factor [Mucilaginibacter sp. Bleaf8]